MATSSDQESSSSMSHQAQHGGGSEHPASNQPHPPPFNPLLSHSSTQGLVNSVVPDLMKIYESITQSSTPQTGSETQQFDTQAQQASYSQSYHHSQYPADAQGAAQPAQVQYQYSVPAAAATDHYVIHPPYGEQSSVSNFVSQGPAEQTEPQRSSSGRALRKRPSDRQDDDRYSSDGSTSKSRKKGKSDGRWSKRFSWPDDLHRDFVSAIFDVGLKHSSPSAILGHMPKHDDITSERIKSHLQKYRLHRAKSKSEFMTSYAASLSKFRSVGVDKTKPLAGGEVAAHLTYKTTGEEQAESKPDTTSEPTTTVSTSQPTDTSSQAGTLQLPRLTEEEKKSPIGASMTYLMGLFFSLRQQLMAQRALAAESQTNPSSTTDSQQIPSYAASFSIPDSLHNANPTGTEHVAPMQAQSGSSLMSPPSSTRTTLEESHIMKRDMQSSREIQNKMRAMKQQEQKKINQSVPGHHGSIAESQEERDGQKADLKADSDESKVKVTEGNEGSYQGAGETAEGGTSATPGKERNRGLSIGASEDFWVNDEQLFEFLMNQ